jgi:hypothetical protein
MAAEEKKADFNTKEKAHLADPRLLQRRQGLRGSMSDEQRGAVNQRGRQGEGETAHQRQLVDQGAKEPRRGPPST